MSYRLTDRYVYKSVDGVQSGEPGAVTFPSTTSGVVLLVDEIQQHPEAMYHIVDWTGDMDLIESYPNVRPSFSHIPKSYDVRVHADGACQEGVMAFGCVMETFVAGNLVIEEKSAVFGEGTSQRAEQLAVINALAWASCRGERVIVYTDSDYVFKGIGSYLDRWVANGWLTYNRKPVANKDLWIRILSVLRLVEVTPFKVKGHVDPTNIICDGLANNALKNYKLVSVRDQKESEIDYNVTIILNTSCSSGIMRSWVSLTGEVDEDLSFDFGNGTSERVKPMACTSVLEYIINSLPGKNILLRTDRTVCTIMTQYIESWAQSSWAKPAKNNAEWRKCHRTLGKVNDLGYVITWGIR
ncbi:MAG: hypothetical protein GY861_20870 [bacterium]|nr:hypothetical protein [bacterium]